MIRAAIDRLFREAGIEIAYPQADLHLRTAPALENLVASQSAETARQLAAINARLDAMEDRRKSRPASPDGTSGK